MPKPTTTIFWRLFEADRRIAGSGRESTAGEGTLGTLSMTTASPFPDPSNRGIVMTEDDQGILRR